MEQRHDVQASVCGPERQARGDVGRRRDEVGRCQWNDLRARRRAGRVQHERDVRLAAALTTGARAVDELGTPSHRRMLGNLQHLDAQRHRGFSRGRFDTVGQDHRAGVQIAQVELELFTPQGRIQRRAGGCEADAEKHRRHRRAVGQHDGDSIVAIEATGRQHAAGPADFVDQTRVAQPGAVRTADRRRVRPTLRVPLEPCKERFLVSAHRATCR